MLLQSYKDGKVNIFKNRQCVCSFEVSLPLKSKIDSHLKLLRMKRRSKWKDVEWGSEVSVRFVR